MLLTVLLIIVVLLAIGAVPAWPHSREWGPSPLIVLVIIILVLVYLGYW